MSLKISLTDTAPYDYFSEGDGSNPISTSITLDNTGGNVETSTMTLYLVATGYNYTGITLSQINAELGYDWLLSSDNTTFSTSITMPDMDASGSDVITAIYLKVSASNDGTVATGVYTQPDIQIDSTENP
jgi:hypothetical protein